MQFWTIHLKNIFVRALLKTNFWKELGKLSCSLKRDRRAMSSTVGSLLLLTQ